ncbi:MAG: isoleucine--tRNA ligase, partial [Candidatus Nanopelagicales bacterium]|nr:isoleucine--tRNA ligase [Candidatus Nanopelagicales bacterium]
AALATLHEALRTATLCLAPFTPFITERVWQDLFRTTDPGAPQSVHLASWPEVTYSEIDERLGTDMALVRRIVELGRAARASSGVRTRQPLGRALVSATGWSELSPQLRDQVCEELNISTVESLDDGGAGYVDTSVKANFRSLGQRFGKQTPAVAAAIGAEDPAALLAAMRATGTAGLNVAGVGELSITEEDVVITETPRAGWAVAADTGESIALDLTITDELRRAGLAREIVRAIQEARKTSGLDVTDRINVYWSSADRDVLETMGEHGNMISAEVLAPSMSQVDGNWPETAKTAVEVPETEIELRIGGV